MAIKYYDPSPKKDRRENYITKRQEIEVALKHIDKMKIKGIDVMSRMGSAPIINFGGCTVMAHKPDYLDVPILELSGSMGAIRNAKSKLESLTGIKLRETKRKA